MEKVPPYFLTAMICAILGFCALIYANTLSGEFVWDDASSILLHEHIQHPESIASLFTEDQHAFAGGQGNFYRPLLSVTFMIDFWFANNGPTIRDASDVVASLSPFIFHVQSILWHAAACIGFLLLLRNLGASQTVQIAAPLVYAVHPLHTEAVTYISGRADSMSAAFILIGLACATAPALRHPRLAATATVACFVAGLLSKESTLIFPVLLAMTLLASNRIQKQRWDRRQSSILAASIGVLVLYGFLRTGPLNFGSDSAAPDSSFGDRIIETLQSFAYYIELLILPRGLHMERTLVGATETTTALGAAALGVILIGAMIAIRKKHYRIALGCLWFLASWLPISGLFPLNAPMAEHWMYVPMCGFILALLSFVFDVIPKKFPQRISHPLRNAFGVLVTVWVLSLSYTSIERNPDWRNNVSIYEATLRENNQTTRVQYNLAVTHQDLLQNPVGAQRHYEALLAIYAERKADDPETQKTFWDEEIQSHLSLGEIFLENQTFGQAIEHFRVVATITPDDRNRVNVALASLGLGRCLVAIGNPEQAQQFFTRAVDLVPELRTEIDRQI